MILSVLTFAMSLTFLNLHPARVHAKFMFDTYCMF